VVFRWFLDAADYWFGYSDTSSMKTTIPHVSASRSALATRLMG
jgi:hypothetical protein